VDRERRVVLGAWAFPTYTEGFREALLRVECQSPDAGDLVGGAGR